MDPTRTLRLPFTLLKRSRFPLHLLTVLVATAALVLLAPPAAAQETVTLFFDGAEASIGATEFSFMGSNWSGGQIQTQGNTTLYASGSRSYHIQGGSGQVTFDSPVDVVDFFFVHGGGNPAGTATAFSSSGANLGSVSSNDATTFGDPGNFEMLDPAEAIARVEFTGGVIDNFSFTTQAAPEEQNGTLALTSGNFPVGEGGGSVTVGVSRSGGTDGAVSVSFTTADDTATAPADYTATSGSLDWADGEGGQKTFTVAIQDDSDAEGQERFFARINSPTGGATLGRSQSTVTINDNDQDGGNGGAGGPGTLGFAQEIFEVNEADGTATVMVERTDGNQGPVSATVTAELGTATEGSDYMTLSETVNWGAGDGAPKQVEVAILQDDEDEGVETIELSLSNAGGGASLGADTADVAILDDDEELDCSGDDPLALCLGPEGRFKVQVSFRNSVSGGGTVTDRGDKLELVSDSGLFTFFDPNNAEILVKVLNGCPITGNWWVFFAGTTNVQFTLTVTDTTNGVVFFETNPLNRTAETVLNTQALDTCP